MASLTHLAGLRKIVALSLCAGLLLPGAPLLAAPGARVQAGSVRVLGAGRAVVIAPVRLRTPLRPLAVSQGAPSPALKVAGALEASRALKITLPAAAPQAGPVEAALAASAAAEHPVLAVMHELEKRGLDFSLGAEQDPAKILAAAEALPEGSLKSELTSLARSLSLGSAESAPGDLAKTFENAGESGGKTEGSHPGLPDPIKASQARYNPDGKALPRSTAELGTEGPRIVGQNFAENALRFGMRMEGPRYNIVVSGEEGTGKETVIRRLLGEIAPAMATPPDRVALTNFETPSEPRILDLPPGQAEAFLQLLRTTLGMLPETIETITEPVRAELSKVQTSFNREQGRLKQALVEEVTAMRKGRIGCTVVELETRVKENAPPLTRMFLAPTLDGKVVAELKADSDSDSAWEAGREAIRKAGIPDEAFEEARKEFLAAGQAAFTRFGRSLEAAMSKAKERAEALHAQEHEVLKQNAAGLFQVLREDFVLKDADISRATRIEAYLESLEKIVVELFDAHKGKDIAALAESFKGSVLASNSRGAPAIFPKSYAYMNLFGDATDGIKRGIVPGVGKVEVEDPGGPELTPGDYQRAHGGFLVLDGREFLQTKGALEALLRAQKTGKAEIMQGSFLERLYGAAEKGHAVETRVKVILMVSPLLKALLERHVEEFPTFFQTRAEFVSHLEVTRAAVEGYLNFVKNAVAGKANGLMDLNRSALKEVLRFSARLVDSNDQLSARFGPILSLLREASYWARERVATRGGLQEVSGSDVRRALRERREREGARDRARRERYAEGIIRVETEGERVGQVNGLAVSGNIGVTMRITAVASAAKGEGSVHSNDRAAEETGNHFNKAIENARGFVRHVFGRERPLPVHLTLSAEQSYGGIDGDSATSTTLYVILSALSGVPLRQGVAMTGSADQFGNVQIIGGVNEKIEGFFDLLRDKAKRGGKPLDGSQGVMIPRANLKNLALRADVVRAIDEGKFRIWPVDHVSQGIEILTGVPYDGVLGKAKAYLDSVRRSEGRER